MEDVRFIVVGLAGLCSGAVVGAAIPTETERRVRKGYSGWWPFSNGSLLGIFLNQLVWLAILGAAFTLVSISILRLGAAYPPTQYDPYLLVVTMLTGAALAKWGRYWFWKNRHGWW